MAHAVAIVGDGYLVGLDCRLPFVEDLRVRLVELKVVGRMIFELGGEGSSSPTGIRIFSRLRVAGLPSKAAKREGGSRAEAQTS